MAMSLRTSDSGQFPAIKLLSMSGQHKGAPGKLAVGEAAVDKQDIMGGRTSHSAVQENPNAIPEGETPHSVTMLCFDEMVDTAKPGDRVTVTGIYKAVPMRVKPRMRMLKSIYKTHIDILHVQRDEKSRLFSVAQDQAAADAAQTDEAPAPVRPQLRGCALQGHRCSRQHAPADACRGATLLHACCGNGGSSAWLNVCPQ